jgi:hypothetical protein
MPASNIELGTSGIGAFDVFKRLVKYFLQRSEVAEDCARLSY